jgi:CheY-like chemotaxis protein
MDEKGKITWQVLVVDDDEDLCKQVAEFLDSFPAYNGDAFQVYYQTDFDKALGVLESGRFDIIILDVRLGPTEMPGKDPGLAIFQRIKETRFVPVVFYTALPALAADLSSPFVEVIEKTAGLEALKNAVDSFLKTKLPTINRELIRHVEEVQRNYMWEFVLPNWGQIGSTPDKSSLAYLLARRLARSLSESGLERLAGKLGASPGMSENAELVHPMRYYIRPPVDGSPLAGDLYKGKIGDQEAYWILLNPSCDMVAERIKCNWVLLAQCLLLKEETEYVKWVEGLPTPSKADEEKLKALLSNNRRGVQRERFYFLPGALDLPDLIVDFQILVSIPFGELGKLERIASLDSPFGEEILARFARYFGRIGSPDLDLDIVLKRLKDQA